MESLPDWQITSKRRRFAPRTRGKKDVMIMDEVTRMKEHAAKHGGEVVSMHINGPIEYQVIKPIG